MKSIFSKTLSLAILISVVPSYSLNFKSITIWVSNHRAATTIGLAAVTAAIGYGFYMHMNGKFPKWPLSNAEMRAREIKAEQQAKALNKAAKEERFSKRYQVVLEKAALLADDQ